MNATLPYIVSVFFVITTIIYSSAQDSIDTKDVSSKITELQELVVQGESMYLKGDTLVCIPTKYQKNHATDPASLAARMQIPTVRVIDGTIIGTNGKPVPVYINGRPATSLDFVTFWPKDALRVEYIANPDNTLSSEPILNFIMMEYTVGGLTRINANQNIYEKGDYILSSKLVKDNLTIMAQARGKYSVENNNFSYGHERFNDIIYHGESYKQVENSFHGTSDSKSQSLIAGITARYVHGRNTITHNINFSGNWNPQNDTYHSDSWQPDLFSSTSSASASRRYSLSPMLSGSYLFNFGKRFIFEGAWNYGYASNRNDYRYQTPEGLNIGNYTDEKVNNAGLGLSLRYTQNNHVSWLAVLRSGINNYRTNYRTPVYSRLHSLTAGNTLQIQFNWQPTGSFWMTVTPQLDYTYQNFGNDNIYHRWLPGGGVAAGYSNRKNLHLNFDLNYFIISPTNSEGADIILRQSELVWIRGNPTLKTSQLFSSSLNLVYFPLQWLTLMPNLHWSRNLNSIYTAYEPSSGGRDGVTRQFRNNRIFDSYQIIIPVQLKLFRNTLEIFTQPEFHFYSNPDFDPLFKYTFRITAMANYYWKDFSFGISYWGRQKWLANSGFEVSTSADSWSVNAGYSNGDLNVSVGLNDIFHKREKSSTYYRNNNYEHLQYLEQKGRTVTVSLTYTFGYGKKVDPSINVQGNREIDSSILK